ncbi:MAG: hypothetical protein JJU40_06625 [Rhodobacteraceae bacterium]|nr:hypothetical protein [Paracoccaceae bacterium]
MSARIEARPYDLPLAIPYRWSKGVQHRRAGLIVRAEIDGAIGWGEAAPAPHEPVDGPAFAAECAALVAGLDPAAEDFLAQIDARGAEGRLRCGIATAWLSARATLAGESLAAHVAGPARPPAARLPINELVTDDTPEGCVARTAEAVARGQNMVKVKCTPERDLDLARVGAIRAAFPDIGIRIDPNESWPLDWAAAQLEAMAPFGIDYCEEPLPRGTAPEVYAGLRQQTSVPIALDDSVRSPAHARRIIETGAADVLILKAPRLGGPDSTLEIIDLAHAAGLRSTVTASLETSVGLHAALQLGVLLPAPPAPCGLGTARFFAADVAPPPPIVDGHMMLPTIPGLGVDPGEWWESGGKIPHIANSQKETSDV